MLMKYISLILSFMILSGSSTSYSYDNKAEIVHNGVSGYWFDQSTGDLMLKDLTELSILRDKKIPALDQKINLQMTVISSLKLELATSDKIANRYEVALDKSEKNYEDAVKQFDEKLKNNDKWYRSPALAYLLGIISGGLLAVGLSFGLER